MTKKRKRKKDTFRCTNCLRDYQKEFQGYWKTGELKGLPTDECRFCIRPVKSETTALWVFGFILLILIIAFMLGIPSPPKGDWVCDEWETFDKVKIDENSVHPLIYGGDVEVTKFEAKRCVQKKFVKEVDWSE